MKQGLSEANPAASVARVVEPKARERSLSADELRLVWQATEGPGDFNAAVRLLILTGQRREEVGGMARSEIDARAPSKAVPSPRRRSPRATIRRRTSRRARPLPRWYRPLRRRALR